MWYEEDDYGWKGRMAVFYVYSRFSFRSCFFERISRGNRLHVMLPVVKMKGAFKDHSCLRFLEL